MPKCKDCKVEFERIKSIQSRCFSCTVKRAKVFVKKENEKEWLERKKVLKAKTKTISDYRKDARYWFQRSIRIRDLGSKCISCEALLTDIRDFDAGHYYNAKNYPTLIFNDFNCAGQCKFCNNYLSGNLIEYRKGILFRYGYDILLQLENIAEDKTKRTLTKEHYIEIAEKYKLICKSKEK